MLSALAAIWGPLALCFWLRDVGKIMLPSGLAKRVLSTITQAAADLSLWLSELGRLKSGELRMATRIFSLLAVWLLAACSNTNTLPTAAVGEAELVEYNYVIGAGDQLSVFVWGNPEVSGAVVVRPDGKITTALVEDLPAAGRTPTELARQLETQLKAYIRDPKVTVTVTGFVGSYTEQVRVIGEAANPRALPYRHGMTVLDVLIEVGGLTNFADGNGAQLVRRIDGQQQAFNIRLSDLLRRGDISANVDVKPGDVVIIPEAWF